MQCTRRYIGIGLLLAFVLTGSVSAQSFREQAKLAASLGNHDLAVILFEKAVTSAEQVFQDTDFELTVRRAELAEAYRMESRWNEAMVQFDYVWKRARADAIERDRWDEQEGDLTMGSAEKLARCYQQTDNHPLAIDVLKLALEDNALYRRRLPERAQYLALLTDSHLTLKNDSEAAAAAKEAIELADLMVTDDPRHTAVVCFVLGKVYRDHNRQDEARRLLQRAVDLAAEHLPETDNDRSQMQRELALFWIRDGKLQEAEALLQQTIAELLKNPVPDRHTLVSCHLSLASLALKKEAPQETLVHCEEVRRLCKQYQWEEHYENARSYVLSGLAHIKMKQLVKAREDLQVARSIMQGSLGAEHPDVLTVKRALAELSKGQSQQAGPGGTEVKAAPQ